MHKYVHHSICTKCGHVLFTCLKCVMSLYLLEYYYSQIAPSAPRHLNVTASTETSVTLSWMPPDPTNGPLSTYL